MRSEGFPFLVGGLGVFFCTSGGAVCAGFAQVTLVELRSSYKQGCEANRTNKQPPQQNQTKQKKRQGNLKVTRKLEGRVRQER